MMLNGTHSIFSITQVDAAIEERVTQCDIHPTGPLWGRGELRTELDARQIEESVLQECAFWCRGLEQAELDQQRRALRLKVYDLKWDFISPCEMQVQFGLSSGSYATMVLREVVACNI